MNLTNNDFEIIDWINQFEHKNSDYFARDAQRIFGRFSIETLDFDIEDVSEFELEGLDKLGYIQAWNHELFHIFQCLFLPLPYFYHRIRFEHLKLETIILLKAFDAKIEFKLNRYNQITNILKYDDVFLDQEFYQSYKPSLQLMKFYIKKWNRTDNSISIYYIFESMAHVASMQILDDPSIDHLGLDGDEYNLPYQYFLRCLNKPEDIDIRFRYLLFLYICYFSLVVVDEFEPDSDSPSLGVRTFEFLCSQANHFFLASEEYKIIFDQYNRSTLIDYDKWMISGLMSDISDKKVASVYAFFETITEIERRANLYRPIHEFSDSSDSSFWKKLFDDHEIKTDDHFYLAKMMIFPSEFYHVHSIHEKFKDSISGDRHFSNRDEGEFYFCIQQIKNLLRQGILMHCCEDHGYIQDENVFLTCKHEDSSASRIRRLTNKDAYEVFKV